MCYPAKALAFWARKNELRKDPRRCTRCAKLNNNGHRQCDACRKYMTAYRERRRGLSAAVMVDRHELAKLERRIGNLEHYWARLSDIRQVEWNRGYCTGRRLRKKKQEQVSYFEALPTMTIGERLAEGVNERGR